MLILGIVGLSGLGWAMQSIGVHGSINERAAINRAVRAPFVDLQRRDAHALCEDFTPPVAAHLAVGAGDDCERRVAALFQRTRGVGEYLPPREDRTSSRLAVSAVHWHGDRATADTSYRTGVSGRRAWSLRMHALRWRVATPAKLEMRAYCTGHPVGASGCVDALSMRFAAG